MRLRDFFRLPGRLLAIPRGGALKRFISHTAGTIASLGIAVGSVHAQTTLKEAAEKAGLNIGVATNSFHLNTAAYTNIVKQQFNILVCENEMKFESTERSQGNFSYSGGDQVVKFAKDNGLKMRGHTFVWHSQSGWASNYNGTRQQMQDIMKNHIDKVGGHYGADILEWDVLNEITADGGGNGLRNSFWQTRIGDDYVDSAFAWAHRATPQSYLYYNDYGADGVNGKSTSMHNLVKKLQTAKMPIHGIGLQSHLGRGLNANSISDNVRRFGELGVRISMTEIDITSSTTQDWVGLLNACLDNFNCTSFLAWGLTDNNSWLGSRCSGCLLYGGSANSPTAKPELLNALIEALNNADPEVAAKRKAFASRLPGPQGLLDPTSVQLTRRDMAKGRMLQVLGGNQGSAPVLSVARGQYSNLLGRNVKPTGVMPARQLP